MKKRFILMGLLSLLALASCKNDSNNESISNVDTYEHITLDKGEAELKEAIAKVEDANVYISFTKSLTISYAQSAVIYKKVSNTYYVLTHYDSDEFKNTCTVHVGDDKYTGTLKSYDTYNELALFTFQTSKSLKTATIKDDVESSEMVFTLSVDAGEYYTNTGLSSDDIGLLNTGIISFAGVRECIHTALFSNDNLGSGLYDYDGNLLGINVRKQESSGDSKSWGFNYAIYGSALTSIISDLESSSGSIQRISLNGLSYYTTYKIDDNNSDDKYIVIKVIIPAGGFSLLSGDFIFSVDGKNIESIDSLVDACYLKKSSESVTLGIYRNNIIYYVDNHGNVTN